LLAGFTRHIPGFTASIFVTTLAAADEVEGGDTLVFALVPSDVADTT